VFIAWSIMYTRPVALEKHMILSMQACIMTTKLGCLKHKLYRLKPFAMQCELMRVDIETVSELSAGQTVCDVWHQSTKPKNVSVAQVVHWTVAQQAFFV